jgi:hypothetical protein
VIIYSGRNGFTRILIRRAKKYVKIFSRAADFVLLGAKNRLAVFYRWGEPYPW